ncbi:amidohydrolase [Virgibacillus necropolis]|uniref:5-methylthioadenosine/S-adenosylhomocysteine deaminase n=1 Tax=Virgibacillus necropolis TaxID=163877 RepID=A0A221MFD8_9BACI|nr:amidohydrolase [Virgibacillus necropolis]ASN06354.1 N-ethylammeline chlorohydrolase [Virgibacillus necropolis]
MMKNLLITNVTIVPMTAEESFIQNGYIFIESDVIKDVGHTPHPPHLKEQAKIIDGEGMVAIPGLINGHTHTPMSILRGYADDFPLMDWLKKMWAVEDRMTEEDIYWSSMLSMVEMIKSGTTTFCDMYYGMDRIAIGVEKSGMRALLSQGIIEGDSGGEELLTETVEFVRNWDKSANQRIHALLSPHAPYTCSPSLIEKMVEQAHILDCSIHTHLAETREEINIISERHGDTPIALMEKIGLFTRHVVAAHGVYLTDEEIDILKRRQVGLIHNPKSNMKLASGVAPIAQMLDKGVTIGIGTDGAASNNTLDMFEEMRFASLMQKVSLEDPMALPAYETLKMGTSRGAAALNIVDQVGTIEAGKKADITLIDFRKAHLSPVNDVVSHLIYSAKASDVAYTIVDGSVLMNNGKLTTIDEEEVTWHIEKIKNNLL